MNYYPKKELALEILNKTIPDDFKIEISDYVFVSKRNNVLYLEYITIKGVKKYKVKTFGRRKNKIDSQVKRAYKYIIENPCEVVEKVYNKVEKDYQELTIMEKELKEKIEKLEKILNEIRWINACSPLCFFLFIFFKISSLFTDNNTTWGVKKRL